MLDKTYDPKAVEARQYERWEAANAFACDPESAAEPYAIVIPPPNVTGSLHMGHALNNTIQDILVRYHRMLGRDVLWQPGTDHAGIATQMVVERQLAEQGVALDRGAQAPGKNTKLIGREAFVSKVWEWRAHSGGIILQQLRRLGASCDWARERFTMDEGLSRAVLKVFVALYKKDLIYKDQRLVNWDPRFHTAISDLEVEQREVSGHLWHFRYPIEGTHDQFITVATTRPETMLGDTAVAVHPDDERYKSLHGRHAILPIVGRRLPIVADDYADPEQGSGAVKITPAHDFNDFEVGRRHGLDMINIFDRDAHLNDNAPEAYRGLDRFAAREKIVAEMNALGLLEKIDDHRHVVPHGDRSGVPIEPWLTDQWYVDAATLAKPAIAAVEAGETRFVPKHWENTYFEWMRNIQPWCISRQLWWGHQVPAWYGPDDHVFVEETEAEAQAAAETHYGKTVALRRDTDVLDTWFSSALWPFSTLGWPDETPEVARYYPGAALVTGFDIIFFWVARMMMMGLEFMGEVPFRDVYIHALVRDERGQKMSKSKGNVLDPLDLVDKFGADAVRFTLAALAAQGRDIKLAESRIEGYRNFATKLWNAARYIEMNEAEVRPFFAPELNKQTVNRWIVDRAARVTREAAAAIEAYRFNEAALALYHFTWGEFCDWYLEFTKPILQGADEDAKAETKATLLWTFHRLLHLLHPFMPFITEELWQRMGPEDAKLLIVDDWPVVYEGLFDEEARKEFDFVTASVAAVRSTRSVLNVPARAQPRLSFSTDIPEVQDWAEANAELIATSTNSIRVFASEPTIVEAEISATAATSYGTYTIDLSGWIDPEVEKQRLQSRIRALDSELAKYETKLLDKEFITKAAPEVVSDLRERKERVEYSRAELSDALVRLRSSR